MMQAHELKLIADKANKDKNDPQIEAIYNQIQDDLKRCAIKGEYGYRIFVSRFNVVKSLLEQVAVRLRKDGFTVSFDKEITNWYSNTDWDEEEFMQISWI